MSIAKSISNTMRSALVAAGLGAATATMLAAVVLPGWAQSAPQASTGAISIDNFTFTPQTLTVKAGTTVTWTNSDDIPHTVTKEGGPGPVFDSGDLAAGDTFEQTFDAKGKIDYVCTIHAGQEGSITVE